MYKHSPYLQTTIALDPNEIPRLDGYPAPEQKPPLIMDSPIPEDDRDARILPSPIPEENKDITSGGGYQPIDPELFPVTIDSRIVDLPVPEKKQVKTPDGKILDYQSHTKHTIGGASNRFNAGIEPKDSLKLFEHSIPSGKKRFAIDSEGRIHQFNSDKDGTLWHWAGRTGKDQPRQQQLSTKHIENSVFKELGTSKKEVDKK